MPIRIESQAEPLPGYRLIERLGSGGFGEVWKATAPGGLLKAIKFVHGDLDTTSGEEGQRAEQELKALSRVKSVRHPYLLSLERYDIIDGQLMIVMELADRNLWDRFRECRSQGLPGLPREELLGYMEESAEVLDLMNEEHQLQHLDIKPQNLFLVHNHVKVADFGLVKDLEASGGAAVTGGVTPVYAAPETFEGWVSRFSDQYSLAIVYQELLTGQRPFTGNNIHQLVMQHVQGKPNLASLPPRDQEAIARALAKSPEDRHPSCMDLVRALRSEGAGEEVAVPAPGSTTAVEPVVPVAPAPRTPERRPTAAAVVVEGVGDLLPALVIGLGRTGAAVLRELREGLRARFGSLAALPHLRLLNIDTDQAAVNALASGGARSGDLGRREVAVAPLKRALFYLRPRRTRPPLEPWLNLNMLYRMQRNQVTAGLRALGRLAFVDNYASLSQRLKGELEACTDPEALATAAEATGLKMRSTRPRVYVVANLAGGTGSGMFLDVAYVVRHQLRQLGHADPDVVGMFFLPAVDRAALRKPQVATGLGNTVAALTELHHFSSPDVTFQSRYDNREPAITDPGAPFARCTVLTEGADDARASSAGRQAQAGLAGLAGAFLLRDLTTPLGRTADAGRAARRAEGNSEQAGLVPLQTFGLFRYSWPRKAFLRRAARRFCLHLVEHWMSKESKSIREQVQAHLTQQSAGQGLSAESLISGFQQVCERNLGQAPEAVFEAATAALIPKDREPDQRALVEGLARIEQLLGTPSAATRAARPGTLEQLMSDEAAVLGPGWQQKLNDLVVPMVEKPEFRLAGTEEALRQLGALVEQALQHHETLCEELVQKAAKGYERLAFLVSTLPEILKAGRRTGPLLGELAELVRLYPRWRYQSLVLKNVIATLTSLRGYLSDQLRETGFCRSRLTELQQMFEAGGPDEFAGTEPAAGSFVQPLYPPGCSTLDDAVDYFFAGVGPQQLEALDRTVQELIRKEFQSLIHVCTASSHLIKMLEGTMLETAVAFADKNLAGDDVVQMFLSRYAGEERILIDLADAFDAAAPNFGGRGQSAGTEIDVLATPASQEETRFRELARQAVPDTELIAAAADSEIVFYREKVNLRLSELEQLGQAAQDAYRGMTAQEHFTPHARIDIADWKQVSG